MYEPQKLPFWQFCELRMIESTSTKLISRKIWVAEKFWNFHTVVVSKWRITFLSKKKAHKTDLDLTRDWKPYQSIMTLHLQVQNFSRFLLHFFHYIAHRLLVWQFLSNKKIGLPVKVEHCGKAKNHSHLQNISWNHFGKIICQYYGKKSNSRIFCQKSKA